MEEEKNERNISHSSLSFDSGKTDKSSRLFWTKKNSYFFLRSDSKLFFSLPPLSNYFQRGIV